MQARNQELLSQLVPFAAGFNIFNYFLLISQVPRRSHFLTEATENIKQIVQANLPACSLEIDETGNILVRSPKEKGYKACFQAHLDMVCSKNEETVFDFATQGIEMEVIGTHLKAKGTTLGADNGIGVAAGLVMLEKYPDLELLITVNEETDMSGARNLRKNWISSPLLFNLDSEYSGEICIGCAGGFIRKNKLVTSIITSNTPSYKLSLKGLSGGHSGVDINKGRANALVELALCCSAIDDIRINEIDAGTANNSIPREASIIFASSLEVEKLNKLIADFLEGLKSRYGSKTEYGEKAENITLELISFQIKETTTDCSSRNLLNLILGFPDGVFQQAAQSPADVETSVCLSLFKMTAPGTYEFTYAARSSNSTGMKALLQKINFMLEHYGVLPNPEFKEISMWQPVYDGLALKKTQEAMLKVFGKNPKLTLPHAGLEVGFLKEKYPTLDCASFGPFIENAHTPNETLDLSTVPSFILTADEIVRNL